MGRGRLPNAITLGRILLSPFFIVFFVLGGKFYLAAFLVGLLFELTDLLDGAVARRSNQVTGFGKILDPLADSMSRFTVFLCLLWKGYADVFPVAVIFYRDALVATVRTFAAYETVIVAARFSGKLKAVVQSIGITVVLVIILIRGTGTAGLEHVDSYVTLSRWIVWVVAAVTAWSGVDYIRANWPIIRRFADK